MERIKAVAIVAVVLNHVVRIGDPTASALDVFLRWAVQFHVPAFLLVSGFLFGLAEGRDRIELLFDRLRRLLVPYAVASSAIIALGLSWGTGPRDVVVMLLTGSALGIYYYVFALATSLVLSTFLRSVPKAVLWGLVLVLVAYLVAVGFFPSWVYPRSFFWQIRSPAKYYVFFLLGWLLVDHRRQIAELASRHAGAIVSAALFGVGLYAAVHLANDALARSFEDVWRLVYTLSVAALIVVTFSERPVASATALVGRASLTIFLYHRLFVWSVEPWLATTPAAVRIAASAAFGIGGALLLALAVHRLSPRTARLLVGY